MHIYIYTYIYIFIYTHTALFLGAVFAFGAVFVVLLPFFEKPDFQLPNETVAMGPTSFGVGRT